MTRTARPVHYAPKAAPGAVITVCDLVVGRRQWVTHTQTMATCRNCRRILGQKLTQPEYEALARMRASMHVNNITDDTVARLRRRGLIRAYDLEITAKGHGLMDLYSCESRIL